MVPHGLEELVSAWNTATSQFSLGIARAQLALGDPIMWLRWSPARASKNTRPRAALDASPAAVPAAGPPRRSWRGFGRLPAEHDRSRPAQQDRLAGRAQPDAADHGGHLTNVSDDLQDAHPVAAGSGTGSRSIPGALVQRTSETLSRRARHRRRRPAPILIRLVVIARHFRGGDESSDDR